MAIEFVCPACGGTLQVGDESVGRVIRCGGCLSALRVPEADGRAAPPNPYEIDRPAPPPPPPAPNPAPTAAAVPVEPRRRRDPDELDDRPRRPREPDDPDDRPRRRRPPPSAAPGYGVFFWLVVIGAVMLVGVVACCGGLLLMVPGAKWQKHESAPGGFRVELPAKPRANAGGEAGIHLRDAKSEGTMLLRPPKQFFVFYRDVPSTADRAKKRQAETDEQLIEKELQALRNATQAGPPAQTKPITVGGFDGREVEFVGKGGWYTARVVVADTRVFVLLAGGGMAQPGDPDVRKFLDSFEITKKELADEGQRRERQAKLAADAAKEAKERARAKQEEDAEREAEELHDAAKAAAGAAVGAALREARPTRRLPVAPPPRPVED